MRLFTLSLLVLGCTAWAVRPLPPIRPPAQSASGPLARSATQPVAVLGAVPKALALNSGLAVLGTAAGQAVLTPSGLVHAWALGVILHATLGWTGWGTCVFYLIGGSAVTKLGRARKEALGIAEGRGGARGPENVWGSAATAALCALGTVIWPSRAAALRVGFVASLATKLGDTFASEVGKAYGRTTYLITTLQRVPAGTEGAVSLEGTLAGVGGSIVLTGFAILAGLGSLQLMLPCVVAAFVANNVESLIGASAQGRAGWGWLTNEVVNFINTLVGAVVAIAAVSVTGMAL